MDIPTAHFPLSNKARQLGDERDRKVEDYFLQKENLEDVTALIRNHHLPAVSQATAAHEDAVKVLDDKTKVLDAAHVTWKQAETQEKQHLTKVF